MRKYRNDTYASCMEYVMKYGIKAKVLPPVSVTANTGDNPEVNDLKTFIENVNQANPSACGGFDGPGSLLNEGPARGQKGLYGRGLFHYRKWWEHREVVVCVNGSLLTGIPVFTDENTLRVMNDDYSYFIPLEKVDYLRTTDGLDNP